MKIIINYRDKEGVTYDFCFSWRNGYYLCICHEARLKKCYTLNLSNYFESQGPLPGFFVVLEKIVRRKSSIKIGKI
jgi:hypothetical protein